MNELANSRTLAWASRAAAPIPLKAAAAESAVVATAAIAATTFARSIKAKPPAIVPRAKNTSWRIRLSLAQSLKP